MKIDGHSYYTFYTRNSMLDYSYRVLYWNLSAGSGANGIFIDTGNMNCICFRHVMHAPNVNEIYIGPRLGHNYPVENHELVCFVQGHYTGSVIM